MTQNYVFKKNAFRFWFLFFCATSILIVPIYYYGWEETAGEGNLIVFISGVNPMKSASSLKTYSNIPLIDLSESIKAA